MLVVRSSRSSDRGQRTEDGGGLVGGQKRRAMSWPRQGQGPGFWEKTASNERGEKLTVRKTNIEVAFKSTIEDPQIVPMPVESDVTTTRHPSCDSRSEYSCLLEDGTCGSRFARTSKLEVVLDFSAACSCLALQKRRRADKRSSRTLHAASNRILCPPP